MGVRDIESFIKECMALYDPNADTSSGSPFDQKVTQRVVKRLGTDPFTVDISTFLSDRMSQAFPQLAVSEIDTVADILIKPVTVIWDPIVREIKRIANISFRDPSTLTTDEADSLGANFFEDRIHGQLTRGAARLFFTTPQNARVSPMNFITSRGGLRFFPTELQSIRTQEMVLNTSTDGRYYFDINVIAEAAGTQYNIGPNELSSIANLPSVVGVQNLRRFANGETEENTQAYVGRLEQSLTERSNVTLRGIAAKVTSAFPEVTRLNVVGFNDPEMHRDVLTGGGLGAIAAAGSLGVPVPDGEGQTRTRRLAVSDNVDFLSVVTGDPSSWVLTVFQAFGPTPLVQDLDVLQVVSANELDTTSQNFIYSNTPRFWMLRKRELTLSGMPGGIVFPDSQNGTVVLPDGEVHIGGMMDVHVRGSSFEESTLALDAISDDTPLLLGAELEIASGPILILNELVLGTDYVENDATYKHLENAAFYAYSIQILEGVDAGTYRIVDVVQAPGSPPEITVDPSPSNPGATLYRWRLFDQINIDLVNPKETRFANDDLRTVQGTDIVDTAAGTNLNDYGVSKGDTLRILNGPDKGDFTLLEDPLAPNFEKLQLDQQLTQSKSNLQFLIFKPNSNGGVQRPLIRITKIEILDASNQPIGSTVPYAKPVDIQTRAFQNPNRGVKHDVRDARLGLLSRAVDLGGTFNGASIGQTLIFCINGTNYITTIPTNNPTIAALITSLNTQLLALTGFSQLVVPVGTDFFGLRPAFADVALVGGTARAAVFGNDEYRSVRDIRSEDIVNLGGWSSLAPEIDTVTRLDVVQILDGNNLGYYEAPFFLDLNVALQFPFTDPSTALVISSTDDFQGFAPEVVRRVQVGARSLGSARLYFLEPTAFEVDLDSVFKITTDAGELQFVPDPTLTYQRIPPLPSGTTPTDGESAAGSNVFFAASQNFIRSGTRPGDNLIVRTMPIAGTVVLSNPVVNLVNKTLIFSVDGGPNRTLTFIRDDSSLNATEVSRLGIIDQINAAVGEDICDLTGTNTLEFATARDLVIRATGTANALILGNMAGTSPAQSFSAADRSNLSPHSGTYKIQEFSGTDELIVTTSFQTPVTPFTSPIMRQTFSITRQSVQRITATAMAKNIAEAGLYYFDVELISQGTGDQWNVERGLQMTVEGFRSDGYYLTTNDENLSFSPAEDIGLVLSRSILENGVDDDPQNATQLTGQNLQITYERQPTINDLQNFLSSDVERVVCANPLGRHLIPHFVRFDVGYYGGSKESVTQPEMEQFVRDLFPQDALDSSDVQKILLDRGASVVTNPIDLIAVVHYTNRNVYVARSQNSLSTGRLAAFIPDRIKVTRSIT